MGVSVIVLATILVGIGLIVFGVTRRNTPAKAVLICSGLLLQSWWVAVLVLLWLRGGDT